MNSWANNSEWTTLSTKLAVLKAALKNCVVSCWRDGLVYNTYSTIGSNNWLHTSTSNNYYGLTISGETFKYIVEDNQANIITGDYPSWYEDLKFGQDCTWQDLLEMEPWK